MAAATLDERALAALVSAATVSFGVDWLIKFLIAASVPLGDSVDLAPGLLALVHRHNAGALFGIPLGSVLVPAVLALPLVLVIGLLYVRAERAWHAWLVLGVLFGATGGNAVDRLTSGYVDDVVAIGSRIWLNLADVLLVVSLLIAVARLWLPTRGRDA